MSFSTQSTDAKAAIRANLELELNSRREKLVAMCEAQVASLRSRLERRVNRIPPSKRNEKLIDLLEGSIPTPPKATKTTTKATKPAVSKKEVAPAISAAPLPAPAPVPTRQVNPAAPAPAARKTRAAPTKAVPTAKTTNSKTTTKPATTSTSTRGKKRPSDEGEKENVLDLPKKRVKTATATASAPAKPAAARSTRAASKKTAPAAAAILSPKENNGHTAARSRRPR